MAELNLFFENVSKSYGEKKALDQFSFHFSPGIYGLLGPNGAGKSTMMNLITKNLAPSSGRVTFCGEDISTLGSNYLGHIGYMPQQQKLIDPFTGSRFLYYMASLKGVSKSVADEQIPRFLKSVNLLDVANKKIRTYSGGMKQRLLIAQALLGDPEILLFDEPTAGLDPKERVHVRNLISELAFDRIVIIATHVVSDIEFISKEVMLLKSGQVVLSGSAEELEKSLENKVFEIIVPVDRLSEVESQYQIISVSKRYDRLHIRVLAEREPDMEYMEVYPTLEDVYLEYFGETEG